MAKLQTPVRADDTQQVARRLKALRLALGVRQRALVEAVGAGMTEQKWNNWERGRERISLPMAILLCQRYGVSLDWIYRNDPQAMPSKLLLEIERVMGTGEADLTPSKRRRA